MIAVKHAFKLYDIINRHFHSEEDSRIFISEIEAIMDNNIDIRMNDFATRKDFAELRTELKDDIANLSIRMEQGFKGVEQSLRDQMKWVVILIMSALTLMMAFSKMT